MYWRRIEIEGRNTIQISSRPLGATRRVELNSPRSVAIGSVGEIDMIHILSSRLIRSIQFIVQSDRRCHRTSGEKHESRLSLTYL